MASDNGRLDDDAEAGAVSAKRAFPMRSFSFASATWTFEEDARIAARELELVLTARSFAKGVRLPMAGVPHHHANSYIGKLIDKGYKIALVEQLEDPKKVKRDVVHIITPGTVVEDALLHAKSANFHRAVVRDRYGGVGTMMCSACEIGRCL